MSAYIDSPCPLGSRTGKALQYQLSDPWNDGSLDDFENTAAIDFTTEIRIPSLVKEKPRRAQRKTSFAIHDDSKQKTTSNSTSMARNGSLKRKTEDGYSLLGQPAQRFQRPRVSAVGGVPADNHNLGRISTSGRQAETRKMRQSDEIAPGPGTTQANDMLKKHIRRETVYIPTEDTTMPAVFMKLFSPLKSNQIKPNSSTPADETASISGLEARIAAKRKPRTSTPSKRSPLNESKRVTQQTAIHKNVFGKNGGKENIPPGYVVEPGKKSLEKEDSFPVFEVPAKKPLRTVGKIGTKSSSQAQPGIAKKRVPKTTRDDSPLVLAKSADEQQKTKTNRELHAKDSLMRSNGAVVKNPVSNCSVARDKPPISHIRPTNIKQKYPLLSNNITNPMMYEENWLSHQEIVLTQLVNGLFDSVDGKPEAENPDVLRHKLLQIYQSDEFLLLYKRLRASILYGALAPPKEALRRGSRLSQDIGMKRAFLNFWTETYDLRALTAAAEVVIGRKISLSAQLLGGMSDSVTKKSKSLKRTLEAFLETFLIRNEDKEQSMASQEEVQGWPYRHTVLRSILIIILLDKSRMAPQNPLPKRLFNQSSHHKSSTAALQALANQLLPSTGDITRPLNHLDCHLRYKQHNLQDYDFHINNLAVDLRDGVILTRLAELFLHPSTLQLSSELNSDAVISTTQLLTSADVKTENEWPLSQHLKIPCTSRATKIFNTQIALKALSGGRETEHATIDIHAEDIVDGHREKTISLLWGLVGKWGLTELIDWDDVRSEITRLQKKKNSLCADNDVQEEEKPCDIRCGSHEDILIKWTSLLAQLKGLRLDNLNTSFADGRIFESIIDEYERFLTGAQEANHTMSLNKGFTDSGSALQRNGLEARLRSLGCSSQFASLVAPPASETRYLDSGFVLGALTFLCSRLLASTKRIRAAIVIQKGWRQTLALQHLQRRALAKRTAEQCAAVVNARDRILWAKDVIIKWWREQNRRRRKTATSKSNIRTARAKALPPNGTRRIRKQ